MTKEQIIEMAREALGGERPLKTFSSFEEASEWLNGREGQRKAVIVNGMTGAGKDEFASRLKPELVLLLDSIGGRPRGKWEIDSSRIKWPSPWNVAIGTADNISEVVRQIKGIRGLESFLFIIPTPSTWRATLKLKLRDHKGTPDERRGRERDMALSDAKLVQRHIKDMLMVLRWAGDVPVAIVINDGKPREGARGWKVHDPKWFGKTEENHLPDPWGEHRPTPGDPVKTPGGVYRYKEAFINPKTEERRITFIRDAEHFAVVKLINDKVATVKFWRGDYDRTKAAWNTTDPLKLGKDNFARAAKLLEDPWKAE